MQGRNHLSLQAVDLFWSDGVQHHSNQTVTQNLLGREQRIHTAAVLPEVHQNDLGIETCGQLRKAEAVQQTLLEASRTFQECESIVRLNALAQLRKTLASVQLALAKPLGSCCRRQQMHRRNQTLRRQIQRFTNKSNVVVDEWLRQRPLVRIPVQACGQGLSEPDLLSGTGELLSNSKNKGRLPTERLTRSDQQCRSHGGDA